MAVGNVPSEGPDGGVWLYVDAEHQRDPEKILNAFVESGGRTIVVPFLNDSSADQVAHVADGARQLDLGIGYVPVANFSNRETISAHPRPDFWFTEGLSVTEPVREVLDEPVFVTINDADEDESEGIVTYATAEGAKGLVLGGLASWAGQSDSIIRARNSGLMLIGDTRGTGIGESGLERIARNNEFDAVLITSGDFEANEGIRGAAARWDEWVLSGLLLSNIDLTEPAQNESAEQAQVEGEWDEVVQSKVGDPFDIAQSTETLDSGFPPGGPSPGDDGSSDPPDPPETEVRATGVALSDEASDEDLLGFHRYSDSIFAFLTAGRSKPPISIAISAPWGFGKTSLMRQLRRRLDGHRARARVRPPDDGSRPSYTVWINAWRYGKDERIWPAITAKIYEEVRNQLSWRERIRLRLMLTLSAKEPTWAGVLKTWRALLVSGLAVVAVSLIGISIAVVQQTDNQLQLQPDKWEFGPTVTALLALVTTVGTGIKLAGLRGFRGVFRSPFSSQLVASIAGQGGSTTSVHQQADEDIGRMLQFLTHGDRTRLTVFIDDLDRCTPERVLETVEAINLLFTNRGIGQTMFILGMDRELVAASLAVSYRDLVRELRSRGSLVDASGFGHRFLGKIVQMSFAIPTPDANAMRQFVAHHVGGSSGADSVLGPESEEDESPPVDIDVVEELSQQIFSRAGGIEGVDSEADRIQDDEIATDGVEMVLGTERQTRRVDVATMAASLQEARRRVAARMILADDPRLESAMFNAAIEYLENRPRDVKRFINAMRLQLLVLYYLEESYDPAQLDVLAKWAAVQTRWPGFAKDVQSEDNFLRRIERLASRALGRMNDGSDPDDVDAPEIPGSFVPINRGEVEFLPRQTRELMLHDIDFLRIMGREPLLSDLALARLPIIS